MYIAGIVILSSEVGELCNLTYKKMQLTRLVAALNMVHSTRTAYWYRLAILVSLILSMLVDTG